jgi:uncharacterized protein (TIGR03083 family)
MPVATITKPTKQEYQAMTRGELEDLSALLHTFSDAQWDEPSLCDGWKVRHVIGHMCMGSTMSPLALIPRLVPYGFNLPRASSEESFKYGESHTPSEMLATFDRVVVAQPRPGLGKVAPPNEWFVDKLIHNQDIRRPQGLTRTIEPSHLVAAIEVLPRLGGFIQSKRVCKGLTFTATDVDHSVGSGPEVRGPGEALVLAMSGRSVGLAELQGDGVATLRERISG